MEKCLQITIDGPSASGKSTVAKEIARKLGFTHIDTGAIYRAMAIYLRNHNLIEASDEEMEKSLDHFSYYFVGKLDDKRHFLEGEDITEELRTREVSELSSFISTKKYIRDFCTKMQRIFSQDENVVVEGRDTGSVVFPQAKLKFYLDADPIERAKRRFLELKARRGYEGLTEDEISDDLKVRDQRDKEREHSPLICPEGAQRIDTTVLSVTQIVNKMVAKAKKVKYAKSFSSKYILSFKGKKCSFLYLLTRGLAWLYLKVFHRFEVYGKEHFKPNVPAIIACNHVSVLDPPLIGVSAPEVVYGLGKKALFKSKISRYWLTKTNAYPVTGSAGDKDILKKVVMLLLKGNKVMIFPEGTRSYDLQVKPLKKGLALFADKGNALTIPAAVIGPEKALPKGRKFPKLFVKLKVAYGPPISLAEIEREVGDRKKAKEVYLERVREAIQSLIDKYK